MSRLKWFIFAVAVIVCPWGLVHAHLCDNVFRQADKLIVKPETYNLVVKDKITFKVFLQNNINTGIAEISLIGESPAFDIIANPRKMSIPSGQRTYFEVTMTPNPETKTGNYPVNFRLVGGGRLFKSFSINAGGQAGAGGAAQQIAASNSVTTPTAVSSGDPSAQAKPEVKTSGTVRRLELDEGAARSSTMTAQARSNRLPTRASGKAGVDELRRGRSDDQTNRPSAKVIEGNWEEVQKGSTGVTMKQPHLSVKSKHVLEVHAASGVPEIDGVIKDPVWKSAAVLANFSSVGGGQAVYDTTGLLLHDPRNLYVGVYCNDENAEALTNQDGIEILLAKNASGRPAYSLFISPAGKVILKQILPDGQVMFWPASGIRYVIGKEKRSWTAEMVIPFSALNVPSSSAAPQEWYLRVMRTKASGNAEKSYWAPDATGYNSEKGFGTLQLVP